MSQLGQGDQGQQGGLMGLAESLLGGAAQGQGNNGVAAALLPEILSWVQQQGGVSNAVSTLSASGLGEQAQSWISNGDNQQMATQQVSQLLGSDQVTQLAAKIGVSPEQIQSGVATLLPQVINHLTPNGDTSNPDESNSLLTSALGKFFG
ncbi:MAG: DUF937 domain-containing protein [Gammaproteobacteria bacterium]|nr:DUF937 domain-containing protein [Gammaproteobacteria bacterium]